MRESLEWLSQGGVLVVFPAGEVSSWDLRTQRVTDPKWSDTAARLARASGAAVLPVYIKGENSLPFHLLGFVHPRLRTVRLPQELLNKRGKTIEISIGSHIPAEQIAALPAPRPQHVICAGERICCQSAIGRNPSCIGFGCASQNRHAR